MRAGRDPQVVNLIAVTKTVNIETIHAAIDIGIRIFGENRVQEARGKVESLKYKVSTPSPTLDKWGIGEVKWHLIGTLQKNKAKYAVQLFDLIHTVDSIELAEELDKQSNKISKIQRILVQVKLSQEETKNGVSEDDLIPLLEKISSLNTLKLEGLMTIPPFFDDQEKVRPYFRKLREIRDEAQKKGFMLPELSMGMSNDFEVAIEEGATMVRIGTALFGERK